MLLEEGVLLWSVGSLGKTLLAFALLHFVLQGQTCLLLEITLDFLLFDFTEDGDWSYEIKRHLLLGSKAMTNLDSILESRDITLSTKVHIVKGMIFSVAVYGCESWTIKNTEFQRIDAFELWCWRRLLRVPWTARRSNQSILLEISPAYSLEGLMLKLKLQYFSHLMQRADLFWKNPDGKDWRQKEKGVAEDDMVR